MKNQTIKIFLSTEELSGFFAGFLKQQVDEIPDKQSFSLVLSGGSTPEKIYRYISEHSKDKIDWKKVKIFFGDERCVPPDNENSNYRMANESLLKYISVPKENIFRIKGENNPAEEAERYEEILKTNLPLLNSTPLFDLILLGLGEDGHTASIFPNQIGLFYSARLCEVAVHPKTKRKRITITGKVINNAKRIIFLATGKNKAAILKRVLQLNNSLSQFPASLVKPKSGELYWLLDTEASQMLDMKLINEFFKR